MRGDTLSPDAGPDAAPRDVRSADDVALDSVALFVTIDRVGAVLGLVVSIVAAVAIGDALLWWIVASLVVLVAALTIASSMLREGRLVVALALVAVANWATAICVSVALPFLWPMMALVVVMTVVLAAPFLRARVLSLALGGGTIAIATVTVVGLRGDDAGAIPDIDDDLELLIVVGSLSALFVPIGLVVWQTNRMLRRALDDSNRLNADLQASERDLVESRRRVVTSADDARSRIERDLHDGAQQRLVALGMRLRLIESNAGKGRGVSASSLSDAVTELDRSIEELRELAHGIYPPVLEAQGLVDAFRAVARRDPTAIVVDADGPIGRHGRSVESAVYFTGLEALANAARHAGDAPIVLHLAASDRALTLTVRDDGPGFDVDAARQDGSGLLGMSDRLGAVGGALTIDSGPGRGTVVRAVVPTGDADLPTA